jgi:hypothetical protein
VLPWSHMSGNMENCPLATRETEPLIAGRIGRMAGGGGSPRGRSKRGETMLMADEVTAMIRLHSLG